MAKKMSLKELEETLLDQIEKLSDDSIGDDVEKTRMMVERSKSISDLANNVIMINQLKLNIVKEMSSNGGLYGEVLGIESKV